MKNISLSPMDTEQKLNIHKTFRKLTRLMYVQFKSYVQSERKSVEIATTINSAKTLSKLQYITFLLPDSSKFPIVQKIWFERKFDWLRTFELNTRTTIQLKRRFTLESTIRSLVIRYFL